MSTTEKQVNNILSKWNPLDVPELIAEDEYLSYVKDIMAVSNNANDLKFYLIKLLEDVLGLEFDENNEEHQRDIEGVVKELIAVFNH